MRDYLGKLLTAPVTVARGLLVASFVIAGVAIATTTTAVAAGGCKSSSGVPCSPLGSGDGTDAAELTTRGPSIQGKMLPDDPPAGAEQDAEADRAVAASAGSSPEAANSTFKFYNRNSSGKQINFKFFSKTRNWVWPGASTYWYIPPDRKQYYVLLSCKRGEKVCFGGWWPSNPKVYWGVGQQGNKGCTACCYYCNGGYASVNFVR